MFNRIFRRKRECRNCWQEQPRDYRGHFLSYDGRSPKAERAAREKVRTRARARGQAAMERLKADLLAQVVRLLVVSPPAVQRELLDGEAWR